MSKGTGEFYRGEDFDITVGSAADIARVAFFGNSGSSAADVLLSREDNPDDSAAYTYAGRHMGMAHQYVWAITRDGSSIEPHLPAVLNEALEAVATTKKR